MRAATSLVLAAGLALAPVSACLGLGDADSGSDDGAGGGGSGGTNVGDGSWPDAPGNGGSAAGGVAGTGNTGGAGGLGATGGVGGAGGTPSGGGGTASGGGGAPSGGGGTSGGGGGSGGTPSWTLYSYNWANGTWAAPSSLDLAWSGANAPPSTGVAAVTQLEHFDRLLVFTEAGQYHVKAAGMWQQPVATTTKFPALAGLTLRSLYNVASPPNQPVEEGLTFVANPTAVLYDYAANDSVVLSTKVTMKDEPLPGAPQGTGTILWDFQVRDPSLAGVSADYWRGYYAYSNGQIYQLDAAAVWKAWSTSTMPFFAGKTNAPDPLKLRAAWFDAKLNRAYFIGPG